MCGICGIYDRQHTEIDPERIIKMRDVMMQRGPDDAGLFTAPHIGLGHRRLSIIDISAAGHQPMTNENRTVWIVYNGEVYNFPVLRGPLIEDGHLFSSFTDTEVLLHGYEEWGIERLLQKINGMFAFAIWDAKKQELILARDRLGVKPLFYMERDGRVYFSSDIKSIYLACGHELTVDHEALDHFLYSYCIPQEYSIFREIKKVLPGHYIRFARNETTSRKYWQVSFAPKLKMDENEYIEELSNRLLAAVRSRMISDVPIGAFLSGGVDSSLIVALMANVSGSAVKTFSMGVKEASYNELEYARMVADRYATDHHEFIVEPDALNILPEIIWAYGEPFADASQVPTYYVSKMTSGHVKVALTGDGGDESFCGYGDSVAHYLGGKYRKYLPEFVRNKLSPPIADGLVSIFGRRGIVSKIKTLADYGYGDFMDSLNIRGVFGFDHRDFLYTPELKDILLKHDPTDVYKKYALMADGIDEVDKAQFISMKTALPNDYLTKVDVATMMNSLEARSPYLDYEVIEFAASIPSGEKVKFGRQKYLLKKLANRYVPHSAIYRKKWGFGIPVGIWFRNNLERLLKDILFSARASKRGYFNMNYVERLMQEHLQGKCDHTYRLWTLLCLELWHLMFIDKVITRSERLV